MDDKLGKANGSLIPGSSLASIANVMTNVKRFRDCGVCLSRVDCMVGVHNSNLQRNPGAVQSQVGSGDPGQVTQCCTINVQFLRKFDEVFFCQECYC